MRRHRQIERMPLHEQPNANRQRHRDGADVEDGHDGRGERHADRQQHDERGQDEDVAGGIGVAQSHHGHAAPGDAAASSSQMKVVRQVSTRISPRGWAWKLVARGDHEELHGDDDRQPGGSLQHRRPEHRGERKDDGEQRQGDTRGKLVAHEHRQQLVLELRLQRGALGEAGAQLANVRLQRPRAGPWRRGRGCGAMVSLPPCIGFLARPPDATPHGRRLDAAPLTQSLAANS